MTTPAEIQVTKTLSNIRPVPEAAVLKAYERLDALTKPRRSLGYLEEIAARYVALRGEAKPLAARKRVVVFVGDHKVVEEGVSAYPSSVTALMVRNFIAGGAAINVLARRVGADIEVLDVGMMEDLGELPGLTRRNVRRGAGNIARGPAMTHDEAFAAIAAGIEAAHRAADQGIDMLGTGEMGIGNTTPAAAIFSTYLDIPVSRLCGPGTGLDPEGVSRKLRVLRRALRVNRGRHATPLDTLAALGGLEIAGICGLCLGGAERRKAVVVDGFISSAGALAAMRLKPAVKDYLFFAHMSAEPGHRHFFKSEGLRPLVDLGMRLGEGTGAAIAMQIIENAVAIHNEMATFAEAGIAPGA